LKLVPPSDKRSTRCIRRPVDSIETVRFRCTWIASLATACLAVTMLVSASTSPVYALQACTADEIIAQDPGCPASGNCTITRAFDIANGCTLDFGTRDLSIGQNGSLVVGEGALTIRAQTLTLSPRALIDARAPRMPNTHGGMVLIRTRGSVSVLKSNLPGVIDASADGSAGVIDIIAGGSITITGAVRADGLSPFGGAGLITLRAAGDLVTQATSVISASGGTQSTGGSLDLSASGNLEIGETLDVNGGDGGAVALSAGGHVVARGILAQASGDAGSGGCVEVAAGTAVQVLGPILCNGTSANDGTSGGCGGNVCIDAAFGNLTVAADINAESGIDGGGGGISLTSKGELRTQAGTSVSVRGHGGEGLGGCLTIDSDLSATIGGRLDASGGCSGGAIELCASTDVTLDAPVDASARAGAGSGGGVTMEAGIRGQGTLIVNTTIDAGGGPCDIDDTCGCGGCIDLSACNLQVMPAGRLFVRGSDAGGENLLTAREQLTIFGTLNATTTVATGTDGRNRLVYPLHKPAIGTDRGVPAPSVSTFPSCSPELSQGCLLPCPTCGDGIVEFPETCDDSVGPPQPCDGCTAFCRVENCTDNLMCTLDTCTQPLGCHFLPPTTPCAEGTATPTHTPSPSATATVTPTASPSPTSSPSSTATATATQSASVTPTSTPTDTPTAVPTPAQQGDANCDASLTAADPAAVIRLGSTPGSDRCGADANRDGTIDATDLELAIGLIFGRPVSAVR